MKIKLGEAWEALKAHPEVNEDGSYFYVRVEIGRMSHLKEDKLKWQVYAGTEDIKNPFFGDGDSFESAIKGWEKALEKKKDKRKYRKFVE